MEEKLILLGAIGVLYNEKYTGTEVGSHHELINKTISTIKLPELVSDGDERASLVCLRHIITDATVNNIPLDRKHIMNRFRIAAPFDKGTLAALDVTMPEVLTIEEAKSNVAAYVGVLHNYRSRCDVKRILNTAAFEMSTNDGTLNLRELVRNVREGLGKYEVAHGKNEAPSFVGRVSTRDGNGIRDIFQATKKELDGAVLKTGWQGINRMLGIKGGVSPGECIVMPALPHNAKTLFSLLMNISFGLFNDAKDFVKPGKIATILDITLENELSVNLPIVYKAIKEHFTGEPVDIRSIDPEEAGKWITDKLKERGWEYIFERHNSSEFTIDSFRDIVEKYEAASHHIIVARVDYLGVANKQGLSNGQNGSEVREMYRRARNIASIRKMVLISPHQLSPAAKALKAMDPNKYIRMLPGRGLYDGCTTVDNEVDLELFFGITIVGDMSYLEVQRGKHRTLVDTPIKDRYRVLKFGDVGIIPWDIDKEKDTSLPSVNADAMAQETDDFLAF